MIGHCHFRKAQGKGHVQGHNAGLILLIPPLKIFSVARGAKQVGTAYR